MASIPTIPTTLTFDNPVKFRLLLSLCAHDFRHDFMGTAINSTRVHNGLIKGVDSIGGGGGNKKNIRTRRRPRRRSRNRAGGGKQTKKTKKTKKTKSKERKSKGRKSSNREKDYINFKKYEIPQLAIAINDSIFLKNLKEQRKFQKERKEKVKEAMKKTTEEWNKLIIILDILNTSRYDKQLAKKLEMDLERVLTAATARDAARAQARGLLEQVKADKPVEAVKGKNKFSGPLSEPDEPALYGGTLGADEAQAEMTRKRRRLRQSSPGLSNAEREKKRAARLEARARTEAQARAEAQAEAEAQAQAQQAWGAPAWGTTAQAPTQAPEEWGALDREFGGEFSVSHHDRPLTEDEFPVDYFPGRDQSMDDLDPIDRYFGDRELNDYIKELQKQRQASKKESQKLIKKLEENHADPEDAQTILWKKTAAINSLISAAQASGVAKSGDRRARSAPAAPRARRNPTRSARHTGSMSIDEPSPHVVEEWNTKYDIYSELVNIDKIYEDLEVLKGKGEIRPEDIIFEFLDLKLYPSWDSDSGTFTSYWNSLKAVYRKLPSPPRQFNFNNFIIEISKKVGLREQLGIMDGSSRDPIIPLPVARMVTSDSIKIIQDFGCKVSQWWCDFIRDPAKDSPSLSTREDRLLDNMLQITHACTATDPFVFQLFKDYFKDIHITGNEDSPSWLDEAKKGKIINNASQLKKYDFFNGIKEGICWVPCVIDAMSNCPRPTGPQREEPGEALYDPGPELNQPIHIRVVSRGDYIHYNINPINDSSCNMSFDISVNGKVLHQDPTTIYYSNKPPELSVTNVLSKLIKNVMEEFDGLKGESDEKKFEMFVLIASQKLEDAIATLCMKLFGDFGQELLSISNGNVFASNDRPSAIRYILLKSLFPDGRGGGGYFPPTTRNSFYI